MTLLRVLSAIGWAGIFLAAACGGGEPFDPVGISGSALSRTLPPIDRCGTWDGINLLAKKTYAPPTSVDGEHHFCRPITFAAPQALPVVAGDSGVHKATLTFYQGN